MIKNELRLMQGLTVQTKFSQKKRKLHNFLNDNRFLNFLRITAPSRQSPFLTQRPFQNFYKQLKRNVLVQKILFQKDRKKSTLHDASSPTKHPTPYNITKKENWKRNSFGREPFSSYSQNSSLKQGFCYQIDCIYYFILYFIY